MKAYLEIEMPTSCGSCLFRRLWPEDDEVECIIEKKLWTKYAEKNSACPLLPVPPHGRLGDLEMLALEMMDAANVDQALAMLDDAPTIIPASEEGE